MFQHVIHDKTVIDTLNLRYERIIKSKTSLYQSKESSKGGQPLGLEVGELWNDISKNRITDSNIDLSPCDGDMEKLTGFKVMSPMLDENLQLTNALLGRKGTKSSASKTRWAKHDGAAGVPIKTASGKDGWKNMALKQLRLCWRKMTDG
jgi:hypothetical protein